MSSSHARVAPTRRELLQGASALALGVAAAPAAAWAQRTTVKLAFIGPLTGGTASNGPTKRSIGNGAFGRSGGKRGSGFPSCPSGSGSVAYVAPFAPVCLPW